MAFLLLGAGLLLVVFLVSSWAGHAPHQLKKSLAIAALLIGGGLLAVFALSGRLALAGGIGFIMLYGIRILRELNASVPPASARNTNVMSRQEALDLLGLQQGASADEIETAYKTLIKKAHPDMGGTDGLTRKLNEARDRLRNNK
ncbi:MAG: DnaJ domain-containing protein [Parvibaculales bacterium]